MKFETELKMKCKDHDRKYCFPSIGSSSIFTFCSSTLSNKKKEVKKIEIEMNRIF